MFDIQNRRYTGSKYKLMNWISKLIKENCPNCHSFFDVFAGTGCVTEYMFEKYDRFIVNDFLYSNNIIYNGFFLNEDFDENKLLNYKEKYNNINVNKIKNNYVSNNFGDKFFSYNDAKKIGYIRENIEREYKKTNINFKEYNILPDIKPLIITKLPSKMFKKLKYVNVFVFVISFTVFVFGSSK